MPISAESKQKMMVTFIKSLNFSDGPRHNSREPHGHGHTVTDNLFKYELQKSPALPPAYPDYYADHDSEILYMKYNACIHTYITEYTHTYTMYTDLLF